MRYGSVRMKLLFDRIRSIQFIFTLQEEEARYRLLVHHQQRRPAHPIVPSRPDRCLSPNCQWISSFLLDIVPEECRSRGTQAMSWSRTKSTGKELVLKLAHRYFSFFLFLVKSLFFLVVPFALRHQLTTLIITSIVVLPPPPQ